MELLINLSMPSTVNTYPSRTAGAMIPATGTHYTGSQDLAAVMVLVIIVEVTKQKCSRLVVVVVLV